MTTTAPQIDAEARSRSWMVRIVMTFFAVFLFAVSAVLLSPVLTFGRNYLSLLTSAAISAAILAGAWGILVHGDLKQRSDYTISMITAFVLLALAAAASSMYSEDWLISKACAVPDVSQPADCSVAAAMLRHNLNAASLEQMFGLLVVGQIIPLLSIFKDAAYSWVKPTLWHERQGDAPAVKAVRRANFWRTRIPEE